MSNISLMGVINLTPNSFSDGGLFLDQSKALKQIENHLKDGALFIDIGAESTAPFNSKVSLDEEYKRLEENLFPTLDNLKTLYEKRNFTLSIDTYKPEVFKKVYDYLFDQKINIPLLWNDVSGVIDDQTMTLLSSLNQDNNFSYVLGHSYCPQKDLTSDHMQFTKEGEVNFIDTLINDFLLNIKKLENVLSPKKVILDPCFGFSKTYSQNRLLMQHLESFMHPFNDFCFLIGLSKKSFMQKQFTEDEPKERMIKSEKEHLQFLTQLCEKAQHDLIFRIHDVAKFSSLSVR